MSEETLARTAPAPDTADSTKPDGARRIEWRHGVPMAWDDVFLDELCGLASEDYADERAARAADQPFPREENIFETILEGQRLRNQLLGMALSGGGIRSASFALGVIQTFIRFGIAERFHYLSSVSGGGYMAVALAWLRKRGRGDWQLADWKQQLSRIASGARAAPATAPVPVAVPAKESAAFSKKSVNAKRKPTRTMPNTSAVDEDGRPVWLDYVRQHGNFLQPPGMGSLALAGVALRNSAMGVGVYFLLLALALAVLIAVGVVPAAAELTPAARCAGFTLGGMHPLFCFDALSLLALCTATIVVLFIGYSLATFVLSFGPLWRLLWSAAAVLPFAGLLMFALEPAWLPQVAMFASVDVAVIRMMRSALLLPSLAAVLFGLQLFVAAAWNWSAEVRGLKPKPSSRAYRLRLRLQIFTGTLIALLIVLAVVIALPWTYALIDKEGVFSVTVLAAVAAAYQAFWSGTRSLPRSMITRVRLLVTAALVLASGALAAYALARNLAIPLATLGLVSLALLVVMFCTNLNQYGLGRMYRDRLMETFMPNLAGINRTQWSLATDADGNEFGLLQDLWPAAPGEEHRLKLYPLINTHVVLVDSKIDTWRGRGGDSFVLAPGACGSDATRWVETRHFADNELTAATAMAASGAAANPHTGPAGRGLTRNRLVSFLMFLMQARLGLWVRNPWLRLDRTTRQDSPTSPTPSATDRRRWVRAILLWISTRLLGQRPNFLFPGIRSGLFGRGLNERSYFLELTDGGHFDNTGVYELIRRRTRVIVLVQASQDGAGGMADLANLTEKIRVDFGVHLRFDDGLPLAALVPGPLAHPLDQPVATRGHAIARILYPATRGEGKACGWLVVLHATPVQNVSVDVTSYRHHHPDFPHQSTGDQFFDEAQLEAYRELGYAIAKQFCSDVVRAGERSPTSSTPCFEAGSALTDILALLRPEPVPDMHIDQSSVTAVPLPANAGVATK